jgi:hypothetical protein
MAVSGNMFDLPHGGIHMTRRHAYTAAGACFKINFYGPVKSAMEQLKKIIAGFFFHG